MNASRGNTVSPQAAAPKTSRKRLLSQGGGLLTARQLPWPVGGVHPWDEECRRAGRPCTKQTPGLQKPAVVLVEGRTKSQNTLVIIIRLYC